MKVNILGNIKRRFTDVNIKYKIYVDCDDTVLNSSETIIELLNKKYGLNKTIRDLKDWNYRSIKKDITKKEISDIYESDEFWDKVKVKSWFMPVYMLGEDIFDWVFISKGTRKNLEKKERFLKKVFGKSIKFAPVFIYEGQHGEEKTKYDMYKAIQIDNVTSELKDTNAMVKILYTDGHKFRWNNKCTINGIDNLYYVENSDDIKSIIEFFVKICKCGEQR